MEPVEASLSQDFDGNSLDKWFTAVAERQYNFIITELPTFKCSKNTCGNTALIEAVLQADEPAVQILAAHEYGCQNADGKTALEIAYEVKFVGACDVLAQFEMESLHARGIYLCHRAVSEGNLSMARSLSPFAINVVQPTTNQTALDLAIRLPSSDAIIEELVNTSTISLETLDQACKTANDVREVNGDRSILELLLIFRNNKEANACKRCGLLRKQLIYLSSQFHKLYSNLNKPVKTSPSNKDIDSLSSSEEEGEIVGLKQRPQKHTGKGLNAKLSNQVINNTNEQDTVTSSDRNGCLSFSLTRDFEQLRAMLPNAFFDLNIDRELPTRLLTLSRTMRKEILSLREDQARKSETIAQLQEELNIIKEKLQKNEQAEESIEIVLRPHNNCNETHSGNVKGAAPKGIVDKLELGNSQQSGENAAYFITQSNEKLLEEAVAAIKAKDLYINSLLDENDRLKKGTTAIDSTSYQEMITSQQEQITHLIDLLYQSKAALEKMSEVEVRCSTLEDDNSILRQRVQHFENMEKALQSPTQHVSIAHKGISVTELSPNSRHNSSLVNTSTERIQHLEATIKSLCSELDRQKLHAKELENDMQTVAAAKSHAEMLKEKVLSQQDEIKRLNDVIGVQQNYLELKDMELKKMSKSLEDLALSTDTVKENNKSLAYESSAEADTNANVDQAHVSGDLKVPVFNDSPGAPRRLLRRANSSRPATNNEEESKQRHDAPIFAPADGIARSGRAVSASAGHRQNNSDMTVDDLESTPTPIQRLHKQEISSELVKEMVSSLMQNGRNLRVQCLGSQGSQLSTPSSSHAKPPSIMHGNSDIHRSNLHTPRQRRNNNKQQVAASSAASSAANIFAARQALGISTPSNPVAEIVHAPNQGVSRSAGSVNRGGMTKLMLAAIKGDLITAKAYLKQDVGIQDVEGRSALFYAALHNHPSIVRELAPRESLLSTNRKYKDGAGVTALMIAAQEGNKECIKLLYRAEKDCRTVRGKGCIDFAKNDIIVRFLQGLAVKQK